MQQIKSLKQKSIYNSNGDDETVMHCTRRTYITFQNPILKVNKLRQSMKTNEKSEFVVREYFRRISSGDVQG